MRASPLECSGILLATTPFVKKSSGGWTKGQNNVDHRFTELIFGQISARHMCATKRPSGLSSCLGLGHVAIPFPSAQTRLERYFTAPAAMPLMMYRSSKTPITISGKIAAVDKAAMAHQLMPWLPV